MRRLVLPERWRAVASVAEAVEIPRRVFSRNELAFAEELHTEKRRREWLASRALAKELAEELGLGDCTIVSSGARPGLMAGGEMCREHLSLSHSGRYVGAAIAADAIGIDIQVPREVNPRVTHLFLTADEEAALNLCRVDDALLHFWCAKEAAWKALSEVYPTLKQTPLRMTQASDSGVLFDGAGVRVETVRLGGDLIAALAMSAVSR